MCAARSARTTRCRGQARIGPRCWHVNWGSHETAPTTTPTEIIRNMTHALIYHAAWSPPLWVVLLLLAIVGIGTA